MNRNGAIHKRDKRTPYYWKLVGALGLFLAALLVVAFIMPVAWAQSPEEEQATIVQPADELDVTGDKKNYLGLKPSPAGEYRTVDTPRSRLPLSTSVDISSQLPPIGDQGAQGSCVGWATSYYYKSWSEKQEHASWDLENPWYRFSPAFVYNQINGGSDRGAYFEDAFSLLENNGDIDIADMPYSQYDYLTQPTSAQLNAAKPYDIPGDWAAFWNHYPPPFDPPNPIDNVKAWLNDGKILVMGIPVYYDFPNFAGNPSKAYYDYNGSSSLAGGHAVTICGYDDNVNPAGADADHRGGFKMANSWGTDWNGASRGFVYLSYDFVKRYVWEAWTMSDNGPDSPLIGSLSSASGNVGSPIAIYGDNFGARRRAARVSFNGTDATQVSFTNVEVNAVVPGGATSGPLVVYDWEGTPSNGVDFTVGVPSGDPPAVTSITPATGGDTGALAVYVAGSNFADGCQVKLVKEGEPCIEATAENRIKDSRVDCTLDLRGTGQGSWDVVVTNPDSLSGSLSGGFTVTGPNDTYEPNNSFFEAYGPLDPDSDYFSYISSRADVDYFELEVAGVNRYLRVDMTSIPANCDYDLYMYNSSYGEVARSWLGGNANELIYVGPLPAGTYYLKVDPWSGYSSTDSYLLRYYLPSPPNDTFEPNNTYSEAYGPLDPDTDYFSFISSSSDVDFYKLEAEGSSGYMAVELKSIPGGCDYDIYMYDASHNLVGRSWNSGNADECIRVFVSTGAYYIKVDPWWGSSDADSYLLRYSYPPPPTDTYEPNNTFADAYGPLKADTDYLSYISLGSDLDFFKLELPESSKQLTVELKSIPANCDYDLALYDSSHRLIKGSWNWGNRDELITAGPLSAGTYYLKVDPWWGSSCDDSYLLRYSALRRPAVSNIAPAVVDVGDVVTIYGNSFGATRGSSYVSFGQTKATDYLSWSDTRIRCRVPAGTPGLTGLTVTAPGGTCEPWYLIVVNTPGGENVQVIPETGTTVEFENVITPGLTTSQKKEDPEIDDYLVLPGTCWNIDTTAEFRGDVMVTLPYPGSCLSPVDESRVALLHKEGGKWVDRTCARDAEADTVTARVSGFSDFVLAVPETTANSTWYLAEGSTAWGFATYITIENPNAVGVTADVTYMPSGGKTVHEKVGLPAMSQTTLSNDHLIMIMGGRKDFSTRIECAEGMPIAVDRTMTWAGLGAPSLTGHCSVGVTSPAKTWYLPEGSSAWGFECFLLVQNPSGKTANVEVTYMIEGKGPATFEKSIPPNSRVTYNMADDIGKADASIKVESDVPVICERAMYRNNRWEGHDSIGTTTPSEDYFLAEGTTAWGFTTFVLVQNPNDKEASVEVTYMVSGVGAVPHPDNPIKMPPNSRKTLRINDVLPGRDFSTRVHADEPIIAERAMYWGEGSFLGESCHDSIGLPEPHSVFYLPDGQTSEGRETFTLVANPNDTDVNVMVLYLTPMGDGNAVRTEKVPANSRVTFNMAEHSGIQGRAAILVLSLTPGGKIMAERAMYWNSRGAGTDTIGGYSD